jgi:hypothetical protein
MRRRRRHPRLRHRRVSSYRGPTSKLRRRYVELAGGDAVVMYVEPVLIRRNDRDPDWLAFEQWRKEGGHVVETAPIGSILTD